MNAVLSSVIAKFSLYHPAPAFASAAFGIPEFLSNVNYDNDYIQHRNNNDYIQHRHGQFRTAIPDPTFGKDIRPGNDEMSIKHLESNRQESLLQEDDVGFQAFLG